VPHFISLRDVTSELLADLVKRSVEFAGARPARPPLSGRAVGIYFRKTSTRTRTAFWRAATLLGADVITYGPEDLQVVTGESLADTARVLERYLDALVVRTNDEIDEMRQLACADGLAVINALTKDEHPTQAVADMSVLAEEFGTLSGRHVLYVGEGNSSAAALALATALTPGLRLTLLVPPGYGLPDPASFRTGKISNDESQVLECHSLEEVEVPIDAVYTSRWLTMGVEKNDPDWLSKFMPYQVNRAMLARVGNEQTIFLHDLPAVRGQEVTNDVLDGYESRAWRQASHKMSSAMAILEWCVLGKTGGDVH
jgi:ornithine carbamoyltransferase